jgi:hypothetical protein
MNLILGYFWFGFISIVRYSNVHLFVISLVLLFYYSGELGTTEHLSVGHYANIRTIEHLKNELRNIFILSVVHTFNTDACSILR